MKKTTLKRLSALFATAVMAVSCGTMTSSASEAGARATLKSVSGLAGSQVAVDLVLDTDDMCSGYDFNIEFDDKLELKNIEGVLASEVNDNVATVINATGLNFKDGKAVTTLVFQIPEDAQEGDTYDVNLVNNEFVYAGGPFINPILTGATIDVLESAKRVTDHMVFVSVENNVTITEVGLRGDVNGDGKVDFLDTVAVSKSMISKTTFTVKQSFFADVNGDGKVDFLDLVAVARYNMSNSWDAVIK